MIKSENDFDKNNILNLLNNNFGKSWQYNKKINNEVIYNKKSLNAEKDLTQKIVFNLYISVILFDSVYIK